MTQTHAASEVIQKIVGTLKRVVIKVGTRVIDDDKTHFNRPVIESLVGEIAELHSRGIEVLLVSSGAVGAGLRALHISQRPKSIHLRQAYAAVGQGRLMNLYNELFSQYGINTAQVLLTRSDLDRRDSYLNARETLQHLLTIGVIPIINENDTVSTDELKFGDNDFLASLVAGKMDAQLMILLTTVDGLYRHFDQKKKQGELIEVIDHKQNDSLSHVVDKIDPLSMGGMRSKIEAGKSAGSKGVLVAIANGLQIGIIGDLLSGQGKATWMIPTRKRMAAWKYYLAFAKSPSSGRIVVDDGAVEALKQGGKSLLASGIKHITGRFNAKDLVCIETLEGEEFARGLVNYNSDDLQKIMGCSSRQIKEILGDRKLTEVIHRDNLVVS